MCHRSKSKKIYAEELVNWKYHWISRNTTIFTNLHYVIENDFFIICRTKLLRKESSLIKMYGNYFDVSHSTKFSLWTPLKLTLISVSLCLSLCNTEECYWYTIPFLTWFNCKIYNPCSMHYKIYNISTKENTNSNIIKRWS